MNIERAVPPRASIRNSYKELMNRVIEMDGEWVRVGLDEIAPGQPNVVKQNRIWHAAKSRGVKAQTSIQDGFLYIRLIKSEVVA